jgi:hypothetical protein
MAVSSSDRSFMQRIGKYKAASHTAATARHLARPVAERIQRSWDLSVSYATAAVTRNRRDDPTPFYDRARRLGLYSDQS